MQDTPVNVSKTWAAAMGSVAISLAALALLLAGLTIGYPLLGFIACVLALAFGLTAGGIALARFYPVSVSPKE